MVVGHNRNVSLSRGNRIYYLKAVNILSRWSSFHPASSRLALIPHLAVVSWRSGVIWRSLQPHNLYALVTGPLEKQRPAPNEFCFQFPNGRGLPGQIRWLLQGVRSFFGDVRSEASQDAERSRI